MPYTTHVLILEVETTPDEWERVEVEGPSYDVAMEEANRRYPCIEPIGYYEVTMP